MSRSVAILSALLALSMTANVLLLRRPQRPVEPRARNPVVEAPAKTYEAAPALEAALERLRNENAVLVGALESDPLRVEETAELRARLSADGRDADTEVDFLRAHRNRFRDPLWFVTLRRLELEAVLKTSIEGLSAEKAATLVDVFKDLAASLPGIARLPREDRFAREFELEATAAARLRQILSSHPPAVLEWYITNHLGTFVAPTVFAWHELENEQPLARAVSPDAEPAEYARLKAVAEDVFRSALAAAEEPEALGTAEWFDRRRAAIQAWMSAFRRFDQALTPERREAFHDTAFYRILGPR